MKIKSLDYIVQEQITHKRFDNEFINTHNDNNNNSTFNKFINWCLG